MKKIDELKRTFFEECSELLQDIEAGLTDMRDGANLEDAVHAVFRGVHSVKGGAGIFGFETLVEFAHVFEQVLDDIRQGKVEATSEAVDVLLTAGDVLSDMVTMARAGETIPAGYGSECRGALEQLIGKEVTAEDGSAAPAEFAGIDFVPVRADSFEGAAEAGTRYAITFRPKPEMLKNANEPLYIIRELRKLGELDLVAESDALPALPELQPDYPYIGWTGTLRTSAPFADVEAVFEFVVGDCELEIVEMPSATAVADAAGDEAPLVPSLEIPEPAAAPTGDAAPPMPAPDAELSPVEAWVPELPQVEMLQPFWHRAARRPK